jgi:hypothetical protein
LKRSSARWTKAYKAGIPGNGKPMGTPSAGLPSEQLTRDDVLDGIKLCWLTSMGVSWAVSPANKLPSFDVKNVRVPVAVSVFSDGPYQTPRSYSERAYPKLVYNNRLAKRGHFPRGRNRDFRR